MVGARRWQVRTAVVVISVAVMVMPVVVMARRGCRGAISSTGMVTGVIAASVVLVVMAAAVAGALTLVVAAVAGALTLVSTWGGTI